MTKRTEQQQNIGQATFAGSIDGHVYGLAQLQYPKKVNRANHYKNRWIGNAEATAAYDASFEASIQEGRDAYREREGLDENNIKVKPSHQEIIAENLKNFLINNPQ